MLKKGSAAAKAFMSKIRAAKGKNKKTLTKVGALPLGFEGKIFETSFKIINQFDIFNNVKSIVEDKKNGSLITVFDGKGTAADKAQQFANYVENTAYGKGGMIEKDFKLLYAKVLKFAQNMQNEVKEYNKGSKKTIKKQTLFIPTPANKKTVTKKAVAKKSSVKKQTASSNKVFDKRLQAQAPGKRTSANGKTYYESRANRSDKGKLLGIKKDDSILKDLDAITKKIYILENEILDNKILIKQKNDINIKKSALSVIIFLKKYLAECKKHKTELKKLL